MREYANIELETTMSASTIYRTTPYEFAVTAEPGHLMVSYEHQISGSAHVISVHATPGSQGSLEEISLPFDVETLVARESLPR
jgi:hypothetical protein